MAVKKWGFIFLSPGFNPETNTLRTASDSCEFVAVGIDVYEKEKSLVVAQSLYDEGVQMIELCGGFGPLWIAKISEHLQYKIPVGSVMYGPEVRQAMLDINRPT